jgi:hypothetical protein
MACTNNTRFFWRKNNKMAKTLIMIFVDVFDDDDVNVSSDFSFYFVH